eukprot:g31829.t1
MPWRIRELSLGRDDPRCSILKKLHGRKVHLKGFQLAESWTEPPKPLTEAELVELMDQNGIGTDASIPQHIQTIQDRAYVQLHDGDGQPILPHFGPQRGKAPPKRAPGRYLVPSRRGLALVKGLSALDASLCEPEVRALIERECAMAVLQRNVALFREKFLHVASSMDEVKRFFEESKSQSPGLRESPKRSRRREFLRTRKMAEGDDKEAPKSTEAAPSTEPPKESDPEDSKEDRGSCENELQRSTFEERVQPTAEAVSGSVWNVNAWHWEEKPMTEWSMKWLTRELQGLAIRLLSGLATLEFRDIQVTGDSSVSVRKGKPIVLYLLRLECRWEATATAQGLGDAKGALILPEFSSEDGPKSSLIQVETSSDESRGRLASAVRKEGIPAVRELLLRFEEALRSQLTRDAR